MKKLDRNDPCHCGSGLKYKKCCLDKDAADNVTRITQPDQKPLASIIDDEMTWPFITSRECWSGRRVLAKRSSRKTRDTSGAIYRRGLI